MKTTAKILNYAFIISIFFSLLLAQENPAPEAADSSYNPQASAEVNTEDEEKYLQDVYSSLEYNTTAFDDLKQNWIISDPLLIREIFNKFIVENAIRVNKKKITVEQLSELSKPVFEGNVLIVARKRFYDDEIELFQFVPSHEIDKDNPDPLFDPVTDGFYLRQITGDELYAKIQEQIYFFRNVTKDDFNSDAGYFFDINLNGLEPEVMFWNTTSKERNKYLISAFGKWGNDKIFLPGWFFNDYVLGARLAYYKQLSDNISDYTYSIWAGTGFETGKPFIMDLPNKDLRASGKSVYFKFSGDPARVIFDNFDKLYFDFELMMTINEFKASEFGSVPLYDFYAIKNYFTFSVRKKEILNLFDFGDLELGFGYSTHDIYHYQVNPPAPDLRDLNDAAAPESPYDHHVMFDLGVSRTGGLLQHDITVTYGYNLTRDINYLGAKAKVMLDDTFGFDARVYYATRLDKNLMPWRTDTYFVFSPVIRINY